MSVCERCQQPYDERMASIWCETCRLAEAGGIPTGDAPLRVAAQRQLSEQGARRHRAARKTVAP